MAYVMSIVFFLMSIGSMSHVEFKKQPCRPVESKGQGPFMSGSVKLLLFQKPLILFVIGILSFII